MAAKLNEYLELPVNKKLIARIYRLRKRAYKIFEDITPEASAILNEPEGTRRKKLLNGVQRCIVYVKKATATGRYREN